MDAKEATLWYLARAPGFEMLETHQIIFIESSSINATVFIIEH